MQNNPAPVTKLRRREALLATAAGIVGLGGAGVSTTSAAQTDYPNRPLRLVVPFPPGGGADSAGRILSVAISQRLGQPVVVENKPGGTGTVGIAHGLMAPADGYTLLWCTPAAQFLAPPTVRYDPMADIAPVSLTAAATYFLVVAPESPIKSIQELIDASKENRGKFNFSTSGIAGQGHLMGAWFNILSGADLTMVPYSGESPAMVAVMSGQVQTSFLSSSAALPSIKAGKLRALGSTSMRQLAGVPSDIPLISSVLPGYDVTGINYISVRAGTPKLIIERLNKVINESLADPDVQSRINPLGIDAVGSTPEELQQIVSTERAKWADVMKKANISFQ